MKAYTDILSEVLNSGELDDNRTDTKAFRIPGAMFKHDMRTGFPLLTTKKINPQTVFTELEFFIKGLTDKHWLKNRNCNIWNSWCNPEKVPYANDDDTKQKMADENDLGEVYGYVWNHWEVNQVIDVMPIIINNHNTHKYPLFTLQQPINDKIYNTNQYGQFHILEGPFTYNDRTCYNIQFTLTGYIKHNVRSDVITTGVIKDPYYPIIFGVGYVGEFEYNATDISKSLYRTWYHMLARCYDKTNPAYKNYGGIGIFVSERWHSFENFVTDAVKLPGWIAKRRYGELYEIDKDYYSSNCYSPMTCVWIPRNHNTLYITSKAFYLIHPDGTKEIFISQIDCAKKYDLHASNISLVLQGKRSHHKKFKFEYLTDGKVYRYRLPINQLQTAIDKLKTNPFDRRMIVTAWNPSILHKQALPPCHFQFQFISNGHYLDLHWSQRSVDTFLGLPFNIASYALLLALVAKHVGMTPRYLIGHLADVHLYENHVEQAKLQLSRVERELPKLILPDVVDVFTWEATQFKIDGYDPHPFIKAPIAV